MTVWRKTILPLALVAALALPGAAMAFEGVYTVAGKDGDGSGYSGTAEVTKSGAGYQVKWVLDGTSTFGAGMTAGDVLWIGYVDEGKSGVTAMTKDASGNLKGPWYRRGGSKLGEETWTKK